MYYLKLKFYHLSLLNKKSSKDFLYVNEAIDVLLKIIKNGKYRLYNIASGKNIELFRISQKIKEITNGKGVPVVYDGVGHDTFNISLECLSLRGLMVSFGQSSGMVPKVDLHKTFNPKSLYYTRPTLMHYNSNPVFIVQALNPYAYEDLCLLKPIIDEIINNLNISIIDIHTEVLKNHKDPLSFYSKFSFTPFKVHGHYNEWGYKVVTNHIFNKIKEFQKKNNNHSKKL